VKEINRKHMKRSISAKIWFMDYGKQRTRHKLPEPQTKPLDREFSASGAPPSQAPMTVAAVCAWCAGARTRGRWWGASLSESPSRARAPSDTPLWTPGNPGRERRRSKIGKIKQRLTLEHYQTHKNEDERCKCNKL
jgi:hypothetical protein